MQNTCRSPLVFVQGLPKRLQAFPQHSGLCLPQGWFPADTTGSPNQAPGRAQGKALPGTDTPKVMPCPSSWSRGLQRQQSRLRATSRVLRKKPLHLQTSEALLAPLATCCHSWVSRASIPYRGSCPNLLSHLGRAETSPKVPPVPWGRAPNPHGADRGGGWTQHWKSLRAGVTQIHHCVLGAGT